PSGNRTGILVTYPEALSEKVALPSTLSANLIRVKTGDELNVDELLVKLVEYGFTRTDFVYEPGQFAIRGGILDVYSFGNEKPYRIELFGNDVDSIRIVDPESQLSERRLMEVSIIPNMGNAKGDDEMDLERVSILEFLPANSVVWVQDEDLCIERLQEVDEDLQKFMQAVDNGQIVIENEDDNEKHIPSLQHFINANNFKKDLSK